MTIKLSKQMGNSTLYLAEIRKDAYRLNEDKDKALKFDSDQVSDVMRRFGLFNMHANIEEIEKKGKF